MRIAINEAKKSKEMIGCGVVIVQDGKIISKAYNKQNESSNATAHAEVNAIAKAGHKLKQKKLKNCVMYCTCEPCIMCLSAASYAKIKGIIYGLSMKETYDIDRIIDIVTIEEFVRYSPHKFEFTMCFGKEECRELLIAKAKD